MQEFARCNDFVARCTNNSSVKQLTSSCFDVQIVGKYGVKHLQRVIACLVGFEGFCQCSLRCNLKVKV